MNQTSIKKNNIAISIMLRYIRIFFKNYNYIVIVRQERSKRAKFRKNLDNVHMKNKQNYENTFLEKKYDTQKVKSYKEVVIRAESKF